MTAFTDSAPALCTLDLTGVWIHDPAASAQDTARHYPFGANQREAALNTMGEANYYAGRQDPVMDYGEHLAEDYSFTLDVPHGVDWVTQVRELRAFAVAKRTLMFRDNRGRAIHGQMTGYRERDQGWGTQVSFTVTRSAWDTQVTV